MSQPKNSTDAEQLSQPDGLQPIMGARDALPKNALDWPDAQRTPMTGTIDVPDGLLPVPDAPPWLKASGSQRAVAEVSDRPIPGAPWSGEAPAPVPAVTGNLGTIDLEGSLEDALAARPAAANAAPSEPAPGGAQAEAAHIGLAPSEQPAKAPPVEPAFSEVLPLTDSSAASRQSKGGDPYGAWNAWPAGPKRGGARRLAPARKPSLDFNQALYSHFID